jgi:prevent-host-death family protein
MSTESETNTRTITASEFKTKCLKLMDEVAESGEEIVITKNGKPVAMLTAYREKPKSPFGLNRGRYEIHGDLDGALDDVEWDAETGKNWDGLL